MDFATKDELEATIGKDPVTAQPDEAGPACDMCVTISTPFSVALVAVDDVVEETEANAVHVWQSVLPCTLVAQDHLMRL